MTMTMIIMIMIIIRNVLITVTLLQRHCCQLHVSHNSQAHCASTNELRHTMKQETHEIHLYVNNDKCFYEY